MTVQLLHGDCRDVLREHGPFDLLIADPPYGDTNCEWDSRVEGWHKVARDLLKPTGSLWVFGSMRFFLETGWEFRDLFRYAQDVVWEKHNGSAFHADRFKRVHEHVVQYYRADAKWAQIYNDVQKTPDAVARTVYRNKRRPNHFGAIWADVCYHELPSMKRDGAIASALLRHIAPPPDQFSKVGYLINNEKFKRVCEWATDSEKGNRD